MAAELKMEVKISFSSEIYKICFSTFILSYLTANRNSIGLKKIKIHKGEFIQNGRNTVIFFNSTGQAI
jgi:hypothetical protein